MSDLDSNVAHAPAQPALNYALWGDRVIAAILDGLIVLGVVLVVNLLFAGVLGGLGGLAGLAGNDQNTQSALGGLGCLTCFGWLFIPLIVYFGVGLWNKVYLVGKRGYSIGQGVAKLRVVTPQGTFVPVGTLIFRLVIMVIFGFIPILPLLDLLWPLWDERRQTLHDKAVGTFVIKVPA